MTAALAVLAGPASAQQPRPWELGLQPAATPQAERIADFHNLLLVIITLITLFVLGLLIYVMVRFNEKRNPEPTKTSHNTLIEVLWTGIPVIILVVIAVPSFKLLYYLDRTDEAELTLKAIGRQWYWSYEYPDNGNFTFDSLMLEDDQRQPEQPRLLATNNPIVLPVDTNIRLLITASDVLHSWTVPSFGVKLDAVPGRLNETWVRIDREGVYYGQCSELCGVRHAYMPIEVHAVSKEAYAAWVADAQQKFARADMPERRVASAGGMDAR
ncbi:cytochrome c oxidase subunit II [Constrictibacter sp. MBR-5]|jgi:cytochrome c oxidase subunit 2|uniref:cytochrome c oxidase subunit II n=1 Tax=Constrictibacter sp. MBR-5 TaxID=3156467 RepID=UPI003397A06D